MSAAHTPGGWAVNDVRYNRDYRTYMNVMTADGLRFVAAVSCDPSTDTQQLRANARLIAAAPALLEALDFMVNVSRSTPGFSPMAREQAERAIALAKGESA